MATTQDVGPQTWIRTEERQGFLLAQFVQSRMLVDEVIQQVGDALFALIEGESPPKKLVVDFTDVEYVASSLLGKLITLEKRTTKAGILLRLSGIPQETYEVFGISKLDRQFRIHSTIDDANEDRNRLVSS